MEFDKDLAARQEARELARQAKLAQERLAQYSQEQLDTIVRAVADAFVKEAVSLAEEAVQETGFGNIRDKTAKNRFAAEKVLSAVKDMKPWGFFPKTLRKAVGNRRTHGGYCSHRSQHQPDLYGLLQGHYRPEGGLLHCLFSPSQGAFLHPAGGGADCQSGRGGGSAQGGGELPELSDAFGMPGADECPGGQPDSRHRRPRHGACGLFLRQARHWRWCGQRPGLYPPQRGCAARHQLHCGLQTFDNGTVCASEQSIIVEKRMEETVCREAQRQGFYFMNEDEAGKLGKLLFKPTGGLNPDVVGKSALVLSKMAGFDVPPGTRILVAREQQAGPTRPYSMEKLCPVLAFFVMDSEDAVLQKAVEVLRHEGSGHTFVIHAQQEDVIRRFALRIPVSRFLVNAPAALGGIGAATGLFPALTLGCGAVGGSSSSNNVSPLDLINIRRVAWGLEEPKCSAQSAPPVRAELVELLAQKILERLG